MMDAGSPGLSEPEVVQFPVDGVTLENGTMRKTVKKSWKQFKILPQTAKCEESTTMIIRFDDERQSFDSTTVSVSFGSNNMEENVIMPAERVDEHTYMFQAPEHNEGVVPIDVIVNGETVGQSSVTYHSMQSDIVFAIEQIYMFLLNRLLGLLRRHDLLTPEVDISLGGLFEDEDANAIPVQGFEQLFSLSCSQNGNRGATKAELPNLMHLAAKYNLSEFGSRLTDLPDANLACQVRNGAGHTPAEMARSCGNMKVVEVLEKGDDAPMVAPPPKPHADDGIYEKFVPRLDRKLSVDSDSFPFPMKTVQPERTEMEYDPYMIMSDFDLGLQGENRKVDRFVHPTFPIAKDEADGNTTEYNQVIASTVSDLGQDELVNILQQVKSEKLTISDAELLFKEWQLRNASTDCQASKASRNSKFAQVAKAQKTKVSLVNKLFKKSKTPKHAKNQMAPSLPMPINEQSPTQLMQHQQQQSYPSHTPLPQLESISPRSSITSNSSRESCMSKASNTSGFETVDEEIDIRFNEEYEEDDRLPIRSDANMKIQNRFTTRKPLPNLELLEEDFQNPDVLGHARLPLPPPSPLTREPRSQDTSPLYKSSSNYETPTLKKKQSDDYMEMDKFLREVRESVVIVEENEENGVSTEPTESAQADAISTIKVTAEPEQHTQESSEISLHEKSKPTEATEREQKCGSLEIPLPRRPPTVSPKPRKMSCPALPLTLSISNSNTISETQPTESPAESYIKRSSADADNLHNEHRPVVHPKPLPGRKKSLPVAIEPVSEA